MHSEGIPKTLSRLASEWAHIGILSIDNASHRSGYFGEFGNFGARPECLIRWAAFIEALLSQKLLISN